MKHGITAYKSGCRCDTCRAEQAAYMREYRAGRRRRVDATETREHLERLVEYGHTPASIAAASGVSEQTIADIWRGVFKGTGPNVADAILAVPLTAAPSGVLIPAHATNRLFRAIHEAGYTRQQIDAMLGTKYEPGRAKWVRDITWRRVRILYLLLARRGEVPASLLHEVAS